tara:strand:- start:113 stop:973 length:861 start_codon:yes stop_codon:yes gene_type:complete
MKVNTNTIPVEASLTTLKGIVSILDNLQSANESFKNAGFDCPYKLSADDNTLMSFGQVLLGGYNKGYHHLSNTSHRDSIQKLEQWNENESNHGIDKVFISFVDTKQSGMKFVFTPSKFGVVISRGYLLDCVSRSNNLKGEANKATSNRNDWRRNLNGNHNNWATPRLLDMANAVGELDVSVAETFVTQIDCMLLRSKSRTRYSYYSTSCEEMERAEVNPYLSQRFEKENFKSILLSVYGEHFKEADLSNITNNTHNYRSKGLPLPVIQSELVYAINYNRNLKEVSK